MKKKLYLIILSIFMIIAMICNSTNIIAQDNHSHDINNEEANIAICENSIEIGLEDITVGMGDMALHQQYLACEKFEYLSSMHGEWYVDGNKIYDYNTDEVLLEHSSNIYTAFITNESIYYVSNATLYRYHIESNMIDVLCTNIENCKGVRPITNYIVEVYVPNQNYGITDVENTHICMYYDRMSNASGLIEATTRIKNKQVEFTQGIMEQGGQGSIQAYSDRTDILVEQYVIPGSSTRLPVEEYQVGENSDIGFPDGWYFNKRNSAENPNDPNIPGTQPCVSHPGNHCKDYYSSSQCYGFAKYIYNRLWGHHMDHLTERHYVYDNQDDDNAVRNIFFSIPLGSHVRVDQNHSFVLLERTNEGLTYYQANDGRLCHVSIWTQTWEQFRERYTIAYYDIPCNAGTHVAKDGTAEAYSPTQHTVECARCNVEFYENHTISISPYDSTHHAQDCEICGMRNPIAHVFDSYSSNGDSGHTKTCSACNCFITEGHTYGGYSYGGSSGHSRSCTGCGHVESAGHTLTYTLYSGLYHITSCSICGYSSTDYHNIEYEQYNASYHDQYCTLCGHIAYISHSWSNRNHNASTHTRYCATCEQTSTAAHTCTYTYNSSTHTYSCTVCGYVQSSGNHSFTYGSWTSAGKGVKKRTVRCTVCNYSYVEYS